VAVVINIGYAARGVTHLVIHDCIHMHSDRVLGEYLLWRHIKGEHPHVHLGVAVNTREDEKNARSLRTSGQETTKAEDDSSLIFLYYFDCEEEAEGEGHKNHEEGEEGDEESTDTRPIIQFSCEPPGAETVQWIFLATSIAYSGSNVYFALIPILCVFHHSFFLTIYHR